MDIKAQKNSIFLEASKMGLVYDRASNEWTINYFLCPPFFHRVSTDDGMCLPAKTILGGTAYVSNKIFNASNFLMVASQANHPLLR